MLRECVNKRISDFFELLLRKLMGETSIGSQNGEVNTEKKQALQNVKSCISARLWCIIKVFNLIAVEEHDGAD